MSEITGVNGNVFAISGTKIEDSASGKTYQITGVDAEVIENSDNLVTGGAVYSAIHSITDGDEVSY